MTDFHPVDKYPTVVCRQCKGEYYRINDKYDPNVFCRGEMLTLLDEWKRNGWPSFTPDAILHRLKCPQCKQMLSDYDGKVTLSFNPPAPPPKEPEPEPYESAPPMYLEPPSPVEEDQTEPDPVEELKQPERKPKHFGRRRNG